MTAYVGLGANLGQPEQGIKRAMDALGALPWTGLDRASRLYRSAPMDAEGPDFVNAVVRLCTELTAPGLMRMLERIEQRAGRTRAYRNAPRTLDLDLLLYGSGRISSPGLTLPHPRMFERAFVLMPLSELAPDLVPREALARVHSQSCAVLSAID